jgi:hypothetical protein
VSEVLSVAVVLRLEESPRLVLRRNGKDDDDEKDNAIHRLALVRSTKEGDDASSGSGMMNCVWSGCLQMSGCSRESYPSFLQESSIG